MLIMLKKILLILLCAVTLAGCTEDKNTLEDIQPTGTTRNPKEEAELRRILDAAVAEAMIPPTTTSRSEALAIEEYEKNRSELIRLNPVVENLDDDSIISVCDDLILIHKNRKCGFINKYGEEIIPPVYADAQQFSEGLAAVQNDKNRWGYIDKDGTLVIPFQFDMAESFFNGLAPVGIYDGRKMGYINTSGEIVIPLIYDAAYVFSGDNAVVKQGNKYGVIDKAGNIVTPFEYDSIAQSLTDGLRVVTVNDGEKLKYGAIDEHNNIIIPLEYNSIIINNGVVTFMDENKKNGLMNIRGEIIVPAIYDYIAWESFQISDVALVLKDGKSAIINKNGEFITDFILGSFDPRSFTRFSEGLAVLIMENEICYIDETGEIILRLGSGVQGGDFNNGVAVIINVYKSTVGFGLIDKAGKFILPCVYSRIHNLGEGLIALQRYVDGTWDIYEIEEIK